MAQKPVVANVVQRFYDGMASQYDKFYLDWDAAVHEEALFLRQLIREQGFGESARILDCACGIGTQAIGLAALGYAVTGSDLSALALQEAQKRAGERGISLTLRQADFRALSAVFSETFPIILAMDNALPHMLTAAELDAAVGSIVRQLGAGGLLIASIRDYDRLLTEKPAFSPPYVHKTESGQRVLFQTWDWDGDNYRFTQYIIEDEGEARVSRFCCEYRATRREELTRLLRAHGCRSVEWRMPEDTGFYQPLVLARK